MTEVRALDGDRILHHAAETALGIVRGAPPTDRPRAAAAAVARFTDVHEALVDGGLAGGLDLAAVARELGVAAGPKEVPA